MSIEVTILRLLNHQASLTIKQLSKLLKRDSIQILSAIARINQCNDRIIQMANGSYSLAHQNLSWLDPEQIRQPLSYHNLSYQLQLFEQIDSTNQYALNHVNVIADRTIISADWQNAGRGRFGRQWLSRIGQDITVSFVYHLDASYPLSLLPLIIALAVNRLLKNLGLANKIKWPNDIYHQNNKIAGILVENKIVVGINHVVIGIGIDNLGAWNRNQIIAGLAIAIEDVLSEYALFGFELVRREWLDNCMHLGESLTITQAGQTIDHGTHVDIGQAGELIIKNATGTNSYYLAPQLVLCLMLRK